jgi:hypothetical protein
MSIENQNVTAICLHNIRQDAFAEAHSEADLSGLAAVHPNDKNFVGVRREHLAFKGASAGAKVHSRDSLFQAERASILHSTRHVVENKLKLGERKIGSEILRVAYEILSAQILRFFIFARKEELANFIQVLQRTWVDFAYCWRTRPRGRFREGDTLGLNAAIDHAA